MLLLADNAVTTWPDVFGLLIIPGTIRFVFWCLT